LTPYIELDIFIGCLRLAWVPVIGKVVAVSPVELEPYDTTYRNVVIRDGSGALRDFARVRAIPELSGLVQPDASGAFLFLKGPDGCRLCFIYSDAGPRAVDFDAVRGCLETGDLAAALMPFR
jgi:hypothetical protein